MELSLERWSRLVASNPDACFVQIITSETIMIHFAVTPNLHFESLGANPLFGSDVNVMILQETPLLFSRGLLYDLVPHINRLNLLVDRNDSTFRIITAGIVIQNEGFAVRVPQYLDASAVVK